MCTMKAEKIVWPDDLHSDDTWVLMVDGTHCWTQEFRTPEFSQDQKKCSHKLNKAGENCELGIDLSGDLIWMNGHVMKAKMTHASFTNQMD